MEKGCISICKEKKRKFLNKKSYAKRAIHRAIAP